MFRTSIISTCYTRARAAAPITSSLLSSTTPRSNIPIRLYSRPAQNVAFKRPKNGQTSARAPRSSTATNIVTFIAASSLGVGAYLYQWNKSRGGSIISSLSDTEGLTTERWTHVLLTNITKVSEDTSLFDFQLQKPCKIPISSAIYVKDDQIQAMRAYTPVHSTENDQETFQLLIKRYGEGQVSRFIHSAKPGQKIEMRGPVLIWPGGHSDLEQWDEIGMIAGGTGITGVLPIIHSALTHPNKKIKISLLFAAQSQEELYFKDELDQLAKTFKDQFRVAYTIDKVTHLNPSEWKGYTGYVNQDMLKGLLPPVKTIKDSSSTEVSDKTGKSIVLVCGPENMIKHVAGSRGMNGLEPIRGVLGDMGYKVDQVFRFPN
ncbi:NADH-cytochrome b5 reductase [Entomortierella lignicola]|nr:NADH-cytochrome b5 reductase [Entomortierella lignicola]